MPKPKTLQVAAVQAAPVSFDLKLSLNKLKKLAAEAALAGAELVVFPEAFLSAYPWRYAFDAPIGTREPRGIDATNKSRLDRRSKRGANLNVAKEEFGLQDITSRQLRSRLLNSMSYAILPRGTKSSYL
ncbi:hypothetical protein V500_10036, partial [Pseudogymnoascus sp. VKM F-4518 (FW-2643)]